MNRKGVEVPYNIWTTIFIPTPYIISIKIQGLSEFHTKIVIEEVLSCVTQVEFNLRYHFTSYDFIEEISIPRMLGFRYPI